MDENEAGESTLALNGSDDSVLKQAACLDCRRSKVKCVRLPETIACKRCTNSGLQCIVPDYHVGRYKGVKNKRSGLEKAIYQVEEAVKKARTSGPGMQDKHAQALKRLVDDGTDTMSPPLALHRPQSSVEEFVMSADAVAFHPLLERSRSTRTQSPSIFRRQSFAEHPGNSGEVTVNNADNPLQLLAIASAIPEQLGPATTPSTNSNGKVCQDYGTIALTDEDETQEFFTPISSRLDVHFDCDPIELGLVTVEESCTLFS